jgi:hypothetical protein
MFDAIAERKIAEAIARRELDAQMRVIALIEDPAMIERILSWLGLWHPLPACGLGPAQAALAVLAVPEFA